MMKRTRQEQAFTMLLAAAAIALPSSGAMPQAPDQGGEAHAPPAPTLEETRLVMGKWIETQQIIAREQNDWQQGKEILLGRLELVKKEVASLDEKIAEAQASVAEADRTRSELLAGDERLQAVGAQLTAAVTAMEAETRRLFTSLPEPIQVRLQPLYQRMPDESAASRVSAAERYQNVLGILNELNKANSEITVSYEVHHLAGGKPAEVQAIYVGLAQAYYVSAGGEAGIGRPGPEGWTWEPSRAVAREVLTALEILQGKQTPAFVPLPVKLQ